jgi:hypothetical protein
MKLKNKTINKFGAWDMVVHKSTNSLWTICHIGESPSIKNDGIMY